MSDLLDLFQPLQSIPLPVVVMRLVLAVGLGALIGWEREISARAAGLRTHMLISLAAAMFTIVAMELTHFPAGGSDTLQIDPLRLIEAVTAGVAFLAAGSIIFSGGSVRGVTTGASMWLAGAVGLASGTGDGLLAVMGTALAVVILWMVRIISTPAHEKHRGKAPAERPPATRDDR
ncbi:MgtC/SapB family protein [Paracoccus sediminis]|uniref:Protein MgtC n=1 Tax=Paracoccus sediminis TaxID=1214787 RepID=A0A238UVA8_9RHOB|nr:MgtC/SapB family protein [Paracoccus sediminis]TBN52774.1 MgtC/SapB family protein [Paracoccus sediminis]SNR25948.1 putative Mg2+ transporter-C (MgtC) family protein [Paracoccus sediminis]